MNIASSVVTAFLTLASLLQGIVAFKDLKDRSGHPKIWLTSTVVCLVLAVISGYASYMLYQASATLSPPPSTRTIPTPLSGSPSSTPNTTDTPANQPSATAPGGLVVKNLALTCSQCPSDPVHVTINSIQIDNANGRMIWDTTLRDITNSGRGFSFVTYDLEASGSTTPVSAVLSQTQFSGNQADMQAIFALVPSPNVTYTLTIIVNWAYNTANNIPFDPVKITFSTNGTPTAVEPQPLATVTNSLITKTPALTCSQCSTDPVHVTINSIQIDNANGRMIWNTTLKDITGSGRGFSFVTYDLEASGSTTPVSAVLSQTQFSGNQADMQAIFALVPSPNVTYTLTIIVNWAYNTANNIPFDPVKITF